MNGKKRITKILAMIICLIFCTNQVAVYGAELVSFSDGVEEQGEISSAGIEEMGSSETEEEVSADNSPGDSEGTEISEEDFLDNSTEENPQEMQGDGSEGTADAAIEDDLQDSTEDVQEEVSDASEELFLSEETQDVFSAGADNIPVYSSEISQDIYWQDNNESAQAGRLSADEYAAWFYQYGKVEVTYQDSDKTQKTQIMKVSELLVNGQSGITMEDLEGTGHYVMHFAQDSLKGSLSVTGSDGQLFNATIQTITLLPPDPETDRDYPQDDKLAQNYKFLNIPDEKVREEYISNKNIGFGWYYIKKMDVTTHVEIRCGDMSCGSDLTDAVQKELYLQYQKKNQDVNTISSSLEQTRNAQVKEQKDGSKVVSMDITVSGLPQYRIDGTEILYDIREGDSQDYRLNSYDPGEGDYFSIDYNNTDLSNHGTDTTAVYNGGTIILTRRGTASYQAEKEWKDAEDCTERSEVSFTLWRYSERGDASYRKASQVKNKEGDTLKYVIPANSTEDSQKITFEYLANPGAGSVCLTEQEALPKYDPEGYPYVYFTRERMENNGKYEQVLGKITYKKNGDFAIKDTLPDGVTRESTDKSIYNDGTVSNVLTGTVTADYTKTWRALAWQGELTDVRVEFALQAKHVESYGTDDDQWYTVQENGADVTQSLSGFDEEMTSMSGSRSMPKYDKLGHELEYRWIEIGVYQGNDTTNLLKKDADSGNASFVLTQKNKKVSYTSSVESVLKEDGSYHSEIVNQIERKVNYKVVKKWQEAEGNETEAPEDAKITLALLRQDSTNQVKELGTLTLDGEKDSVETQIQDEEGNVIRAAETESWQGEFLDLPLYDKDGRWHDYLVVEKDTDAYRVIYGEVQFDEETLTYYREIINRPGAGNFQFINVRKEWIDDSDAEHRGDVTFTIYQRIGENEFQEIQTVTLKALDFWQKQVEIPTDLDLKNILVLETSVSHTGNNGEAKVPCDLSSNTARDYSGEEMEQIWKRYQDSSSAQNPAIYYHSDEHWYRVMFQTKNIEGISYYTITNQRLGRILLDVTKEWIDGDGTRRTELREALKTQGLGLYAKLICDQAGVIDYQKGTINTGTGEHAPVDADGKTVSMYQEISIDTAVKNQKFYFYDLPKYDENGSVVHYSVKEVYAKKTPDGSYQELSLNELKQTGITTEYTSLTSSKYQVGDSHTKDQQHFYLRNKLSGTKKIVFHKQWKDHYRFEKGDRPDIYLNLYRQVHEADGSVKLELFYKDHLWRPTEEGDSHYDWTVDFDNLPKYDEYGYEILYYAQEKMHVNAELFDYTTVEYLDPEKNLIGNEEGFLEEVTEDTRLAQLSDGSWILGENGTFVNCLKEDIRIEGKKIWGNVPRGFDKAVLPKATFTIYQKLEEEKGEGSECASVTIKDWSKQYVNAAYRFLLEYMGENCNRIDTDADGRQKLTAESADGTDQKLPLYDKDGRRYSYTVKETMEGIPKDREGKVFLQPEIHNFMVENFYESEKGNLTVKKILEAEKTEEEKYPSVTYVLTRYYMGKDENGKDVLKRDISFKKMLTLDYNEFSPVGKDIGLASAEGTFEDLEIYAPSGEKFQYRIEEKKISETYDSYSLAFAKPGNRDKAGRLIRGQTGDQLQGEENPQEYRVENLYASDDEEKIPDATFKNVLSDDRIVIEGTKKWDDNNNLFGFRPSVDELNSQGLISFEVIRYAEAQPGMRNAIGSALYPLKVVDEQGHKPYQIVWEKVKGKNDRYLFQITGTDGELEKYAPNGIPWKYGIREIYARDKEDGLPGYRDNTRDYWCYFYGKKHLLKEDKTYEAEVAETTVTNHVRVVTARIEKRWRTLDVKHKDAENADQVFSERPENITDKSDIRESTGADYLGYYLSLQFVLQGRVKACYNAQGENVALEEPSSWMGLKELFKGSRKEKGFAQTRPLQEILKNLVQEDASVTVSEDGVNVILQGYMKDNTCWMHKLQYLPKYAKGGAYNKEGCYYELEYRLCEENISFRQSKDAEILFKVDLSKASLSETPDGILNEIISRGTGKFDPFFVMGFFRGTSGTDYSYGNHESDSLSVWANAFPVTRLKVSKVWNDTSNVYGTRVLDKNGNWTVSFAVQRRAVKLEAGSTWKSPWQNLSSTDKTGNKTEVRITLSGEDNVEAEDINEKSTELGGLPVYGIESIDGTYQVVRYEYRARELNTDGTMITEPEGETSVNHAYSGSFSGGIYDVDYQDGKKKNNETDGDWRYRYITTVTNSFDPTVRYAEKKWDLSQIPEKFRDEWNCPEITLEIQYQKADGSYQSFSKRAIVVLNGEKDSGVTQDTSKDGLLPAYGEYDSWKAIWKGLPEYIPGSATIKKDGKDVTVYHVRENHGGYYQEEEKNTAEGKERNGETEKTAFCFVNTPTEIQASKTVDLGETKKFNLNDRIFGFTLTNNGKVQGTYHAVIAMETEKENGTAVVTKEQKDITVGREFYLKNNQTITIYGLPIYRNNDGKNKITYYIEETDSSGKKKEDGKDSGYVPGFRTEIEAENTNLSNSVSGKSGGAQFADTKETHPSFAFRNILEGSIEIIKTDGTGKALQNVEFLLQYRKDDGKTDEDSEAEYRNLDATVCSNRNLVRNNGIAKTDKNGRITFRGLKLGYKYRLTEIRPLAGTQGLENSITDIELPMLLKTKSGNEIKPVAETQGRFVYVKLKYKISNNTFTMPMTSGNGFFWPGILGLIATGIGGAFWISSGSRNRNSKKKGEYAE